MTYTMAWWRHIRCAPQNTFLGTFQRRQWHPTPVLLPGKSHGRRSLVGCSPWGRTESDTTEQLPFHFSLSRIGEGNGNPLQCSCLENPRDGRACWADVCGVAQNRTRLRRLSSSSRYFPVFLISGFFLLLPVYFCKYVSKCVYLPKYINILAGFHFPPWIQIILTVSLIPLSIKPPCFLSATLILPFSQSRIFCPP